MPVDDAALVYRDEKGSELTFPEMDNRIRALADAHDSLEETVLLAINADGTLKSAKVGYAADTGASDAYSVTITGSYANLDALLGVVIVVKANTTNQGAVTLAVNGFAATAVKKNHGLTLDDADIVVSKVAAFLYNGTDFQLLNPRSSAQSNYGADAGSANAYKIEFADLPALAASKFQMPTALYAGYRVSIKAANDNTTASTLEVKIVSPSTSLTGSIKKNNNQDPIAGDIKANLTYDFQWDGTYWQLMNLRTRSFRQTGIAIPTSDGALASTITHGLGLSPDFVQLRLINKGNASAVAHGYSVGDRVSTAAFYRSDAEVDRFLVNWNATSIQVACRTTTGGNGVFAKKDGSGTAAITAAELAQDFDLEVYAAITN